MTYSVDLRERVVEFVRSGGKKSEAARRFKVCRSAVYDWLRAESLAPKRHGRRKRKLDWEALKHDISEYPDKILRERAEQFGVREYAIEYACKQMKISHKKNFSLQRKKP